MRFALIFSLLAATHAFAGAKEELSKPLKTVVNSVRYGKDLVALKNFASEEQGKYMLGENWEKGTPAQRKEFSDLFQTLFGKLAFPKIREMFKFLDQVLYDEPTVNGNSAEIGSTILINHPMKKQELKVKYKMAKGASGWQVVDVLVLGDSMLKGIRDDQVLPLVKEGGWPALLKAMQEKAAELKNVVLK